MVTQFRNTMRRGWAAGALALFALAGILFGIAGNATAQTALLPPSPTVVAQPPTVNVPATRSASISVTWVITNGEDSEPITAINSPGATLFSDGGTLELPAPISRAVNLGPGQSVRLRETMVVPHSFLTRALQAGDRTISVERFFQIMLGSGQTGQLEGALEINLTGSLGAEVQISRIDLRFQNEAVQIIVPQKHPPKVRADITYTGTGLFRAVWELADPRVTAAGGNPAFRVLRQERIRLGIGGFTRVKGPNLPAELTGLHIVRFRVLDGPLAGEATVVRYFVKAAAPDGEDWWKRYIRPHREGEGLVRAPAEPDESEVTVEEAAEPETAGPPAGAAPEPGPPAEEPADSEPATDQPADAESSDGEPSDEEPAEEESANEEAGADDAEEETPEEENNGG